ncbi:MAG: hypothetical protein AB1304_04125 [Bacteroidota bacterium]
MHPLLKNVLALVLGLFGGSAINMLIVTISPHIIPPPANADVTTEEGLKQSIHLFQPIHFLMPFLAHSIGTFVGAYIAAKLASSHKPIFALIIGIFFLSGGIYMVTQLPSPLWFNILDLGLAYIPAAWLAVKLAVNKN